MDIDADDTSLMAMEALTEGETDVPEVVPKLSKDLDDYRVPVGNHRYILGELRGPVPHDVEFSLTS